MAFKEQLLGLSIVTLLLVLAVQVLFFAPNSGTLPTPSARLQQLPPAQLDVAPEGTVLRAFHAFLWGDSCSVNLELSPQGHTSAAVFCDGHTVTCLSENYGQLGTALTEDAIVVHQTDTAARVVLKSTWENHAEPLCQEYALNHTPAGWRISYIDNPRQCAVQS